MKSVSENVSFKGDKLILHHKNDTLTIEESSSGYKTYRNGKREKGKWEEQDIAEYAVDFLTQVTPDDIKEEVLADVASVKWLYVWHCLQYALLFSVLWSAVGLVLFFLGNMHWVLCAVFFLRSLCSFCFFRCSFPSEKKKKDISSRRKKFIISAGTFAAGRWIFPK